MVLTLREALWFLPLVAPICLWVAWSDMKFMKIPNKAVLALAAVFAVVGLIALPLEVYAWRWGQLLGVLLFGFLFTVIGAMGAGDAKFMAAMAPFVAAQDVRLFGIIFLASLLVAFATHRLARALPVVRAATPDWLSWTHRKFPMGLALAGSLLFYLALGIFIER